MLGFNSLSDSPISDISLPVITGTIYVTDSNDTADISGQTLSDNYILAVDGNDTANFVGEISISGVISTTDSNDTANIIGETTPTPPEPNIDTHDGFTKDEIKRAKELDKKLEKARLKLIEAKKAQKLARKQKISELVSPPVAKIQQAQVESVTVVESNEPLKQIIKATQEIKRLEKKQAELERLAQLRVQQAYAEAQLAIIQAKLQAELDDEESILALLL